MTAAALLTWTLEDELEALLAGEADDCLACGERAQVENGRIHCPGCGSVVAPGEPEHPGQPTLA